MTSLPAIRLVLAVMLAPALAVIGFSSGWLLSPKQAGLVALFATPAVAFLVWLALGGARDRRGPPGGLDRRRWSRTSRAFHWLMALCIFGTTSLFYWMSNLDFVGDEAASRQTFREWLVVHKSLGLVVLLLVALRAAWNLAVPRPPLPPTMSRRQRTLAHAVHFTIYGLMLLVPIFGWAASMTYGATTSFFGLFEMPVLLPKDEDLVAFFHPGHRYLAWSLLTLVGLHIAAALWHHRIARDATLWRMLPGS